MACNYKLHCVASGIEDRRSQMQFPLSGSSNMPPSGGSFTYAHPTKPYAITEAMATGGQIPLRGQQVEYTAFMRPQYIAEAGYEAVFAYNAAHERVSMELRLNGSLQETRYYLGGCYEVHKTDTGEKEILYLGGSAYSAPAAYVRQGGTWEVQYLCRDYLGSITHVVNSTGAVLQELSYDAWGRLRNPATHALYSPGTEPTLLLGRGYTGHEHLPWFGLVNMNARLYDAALGRFLSPDPYVVDFWSSHDYNRYTYARNNPLVYVDQEGEFWLILGMALLGAYIGGSIANDSFDPTVWDYKSADTWLGMGIGGALGALGGAWLGTGSVNLFLGVTTPYGSVGVSISGTAIATGGAAGGYAAAGGSAAALVWQTAAGGEGEKPLGDGSSSKPQVDKDGFLLPEPPAATGSVVSMGEYTVKNRYPQYKGGSYALQGVGALLDVVSMYNNTLNLKERRISTFEYSYEWAKTLTPYAVGYSMGPAAGVLVAPSVMWFDWAARTANDAHWGMEQRLRTMHYRMFQP